MALPVDAEVGGAGRRGMRRVPAGRSRFTLVTRPGGARPPAAARSRHRRCAAPRCQGHRRRAGGRTPSRRQGLTGADRAVAAGTESGAAVVFIAFPPVQGPAALVRTLGAAGALRLARFLTLPARRMDHELFRGESGRLLLAGDAPHADAPVSGVYGWLLAILGQDVGFPGTGRRSWRPRWPGARRRPARSYAPGSGWSASTWLATAQRVDEVMKRFAPDFGARVLQRTVQHPVMSNALTPTSCTARSTVAPHSCTSSWCSARYRGSSERRRRCRGYTWAVPPRIPTAACTAFAAG